MKKRFFIPAIFVLIALHTLAQPHQRVGGVNIHHTDSKKIHFRSSHTITSTIHLPADGPVTEYLNGQLLFKGLVKKQKLHGEWSSFYINNNKLDSGYLHNGIPDGEWKHWDSSGQLIAIRQYDAGKLQQVKEEMRLANPKRTFYALTSLYQSDRWQALYAISAAYSFSFSEKQYLSQSLQQLVASNSSSTTPYIPVFNECLQHGLYMNFFTGGVAKDSGYYKNGLKDGVWLHRNTLAGYYYMGAYKNGLPFREWKQYDEAGNLQAIIFYNKEGLEEGRKIIRR